MLNRFPVDKTRALSAEVMRYCKMESVSLADLARAGNPPKTVEHKMKAAAFRILKRVDRRLDAMIDRLSTETEGDGMAEGRIS